MQLSDFGGDDDAASAAEYLDMLAAALLKQVDHVFEKLDMPALVAGHRDSLRVFLQSGGHDFVHRAVVAKVNNFRAVGNQKAAHDVDGDIVTVKKRSGCDETDFVRRLVFGGLQGNGRAGHWILKSSL